MYVMVCAISHHLYNFKKSEKHPWKSVTFNKWHHKSVQICSLIVTVYYLRYDNYIYL